MLCMCSILASSVYHYKQIVLYESSKSENWTDWVDSGCNDKVSSKTNSLLRPQVGSSMFLLIAQYNFPLFLAQL